MANAGASIEAVLKLNSIDFTEGLSGATKALDAFKKSTDKLKSDSTSLAMERLRDAMVSLEDILARVSVQSKSSISTFSKLSQAVNQMATGLTKLSSDSLNAGEGMTILNNIFKAFGDALKGTEVTIKGVSSALREIGGSSARSVQSTTNSVASLNEQFLQLSRGILAFNRIDASSNKVKQQMALMSQEFNKSKAFLMEFANSGVVAFNRIDASSNKVRRQMQLMENEFEKSKLFLEELAWTGVEAFNKISTNEDKATASSERLSIAQREVATASQQASTGLNTTSASASKGTASMNQMATASTKLGNALYSLMRIGRLVGIMFGYQIAYQFLHATTETIHARSEAEQYFRMLNWGQGEIDAYNDALDRTVQQFQRVNKYSLSETITSIGIEFGLSREEMEEAMPVVSMITSEYMRAGRTADEASLAVKDILQGQFQRLSRETGVGEEELIEAGWSGDVKDTVSLLKAIQKIGKERHWDQFAEKASSLNDVITILQNRFSEWASEMVNMVQPAIVNAFNSIMSFAGGLSESLGSVWQWLSGNGLGQSIVKIGLLASGFMYATKSLVAFRTGSTLLQASQMGLKSAIAGTVLGLKQEQLANMGARDSIIAHMLGLNQETIAEQGMTVAINESIFARRMEETATLSQGTAIALVRDEETGAIIVKEGLSLATAENTTTTIGFTGALGMMIAGEQLAEGETLSLTGALGALTGAFLTSPIGWFTMAVLALASAFYVLTGGMDSCWSDMQRGNEILDNAGDYYKKNQKYLEDLKNEVGETDKKYKNAEKTVDNFTKSLQSTSYWANHSKKAYENLEDTMSTNSKPILEDYGFSDEDILNYDAQLTGLATAKDKYYHAEQVYNKQIGDENSRFTTGLKENLDTLNSYNGDMKGFVDEYTKNYRNLADHSYLANTAEDWWTWLWNSLYAGLDQFWINWQEFGVKLGQKINKDGVVGAVVDALKYAFGTSEGQSGVVDVLFSGTELLLGIDVKAYFKNIKFEFNPDKFTPDNVLDALFIDDNDAQFLFGKGATADGVNANINNFLNDLIKNILNFNGRVGALPISALLGNWDDMADAFTQWVNDGVVWINNNLSYMYENLKTNWNNFWAEHPLIDEENFSQFMGDLSTIGNSIYNNFLVPLGNFLWQGFLNFLSTIPFLDIIVSLLTGDTEALNQSCSTLGTNLAKGIIEGFSQTLLSNPFVRWIAEQLGLVPNENQNAYNKGKGVGDNLAKGTKSGTDPISDNVHSELNTALDVGDIIDKAWRVGSAIGSKLWEGINSVLQIHSPGFIHDQIQAEFGTYIPQAINDSGNEAYSVAQSYGQSVVSGVSNMYSQMPQISMDFFSNGALSEYQADANTVTTLSNTLSSDTVGAFNTMQSGVNASVGGMATDVTTQYTSMQQKQNTMLTTMQTSNVTSFKQMQTQTNQSLLTMRDQTSQVTTQMISAWSHMKTQLVATANALRSESTTHFNTLSSTIGSFYRKIQNPANWGSAGGSSNVISRSPNISAGRRIASAFTGGGRYAGGYDGYKGKSVMSASSLKRMLCPNGDCDGLFDGYNANDQINVLDFLMSVEDGGFGWNSWKGTHYNHIKNKSDQWSMKSPQLLGRINTDANFKVGDFENGSPKISFGSFQSMAESLFSAIPYKMYYNSDWKGSWLGAIQAGACNCWDGAHALLAFANTCGFSGSIAHGSWNGVPHVWAVIEGRKMDTTGWQQRGTWTPSASAGGLSNMKYAGGESKTINVTIDMKNSTIYGVDDLDERITDATKKAMQEEFTDPLTIAL